MLLYQSLNHCSKPWGYNLNIQSSKHTEGCGCQCRCIHLPHTFYFITWLPEKKISLCSSNLQLRIPSSGIANIHTCTWLNFYILIRLPELIVLWHIRNAHRNICKYLPSFFEFSLRCLDFSFFCCFLNSWCENIAFLFYCTNFII